MIFDDDKAIELLTQGGIKPPVRDFTLAEYLQSIYAHEFGLIFKPKGSDSIFEVFYGGYETIEYKKGDLDDEEEHIDLFRENEDEAEKAVVLKCFKDIGIELEWYAVNIL